MQNIERTNLSLLDNKETLKAATFEILEKLNYLVVNYEELTNNKKKKISREFLEEIDQLIKVRDKQYNKSITWDNIKKRNWFFFS